MGEFFNGWRRKIGCMTLVMACVFMARWMTTLTESIDIVDWRSRIAAHGITALLSVSPRWASRLDLIIPLTLLSAYLLLGNQNLLKTGTARH